MIVTELFSSYRNVPIYFDVSSKLYFIFYKVPISYFSSSTPSFYYLSSFSLKTIQLLIRRLYRTCFCYLDDYDCKFNYPLFRYHCSHNGYYYDFNYGILFINF